MKNVVTYLVGVVGTFAIVVAITASCIVHVAITTTIAVAGTGGSNGDDSVFTCVIGVCNFLLVSVEVKWRKEARRINFHLFHV